MKVLLGSCNRLRMPYPVYPVGLDYVAGAISPPHDVEVIDACQWGPGRSEHLAQLAALVARFRPDVVGLSIRNIDTDDQTDRRWLLDDIKEGVQTVRSLTTAPIVLGGAGFTLYPNELLAATGADYGIVGEGERIALLLAALERGETEADIPGVVRPGRAAQMPPPWNGPIRPRIAANSDLVFYLRNGGILNLQTKRGCPFDCIYCSYPVIEGKTVRCVEPAEAATWARALQSVGARFLFLTDSVFNVDVDHSLALADAFRREGVTIPWGALFAPLSPPNGYYERLAQAGCTHVEFGTDAISDSMLVRLRKPHRTADVLRAHDAAVGAGLHVAHFLLLGGPGEDASTLAETLDNARRLPNAAVFFFCGIRIHPGTKIFQLAIEEGQIVPDHPGLTPTFYRPRSLSLDDLQARVVQYPSRGVNWVVGSGGDRLARAVHRRHCHGQVGPLWERLIASR